MSKDFDIIDMNDKKAEKFAEAVKNPTSKKIWQFLKKKRASQKDISQKLNIPMPTVHYSLERLIAAGLVVIDDYYWSPKGNKVHLYTASNKVMVFTPNKTPFLEQHLKAVLGIAVAMIAIIALVAFQGTGMFSSDSSNPLINSNSNSNLQKFSSEEEFLDAINGLGGSNAPMLRGGVEDVSTTALSANSESASGVSSSGKSDFSGTNIQVEGVDEADIIKTDGDYIYLVSNGKLVVVDVKSASDAKIISEYDMKGFYGSELFVSGDRLMVIGSKDSWSDPVPLEGEASSSMIAPGGYYPYGPLTQIRLFDVSSRDSPELLRTVEFEGSYLTSRLVDEHAYFVVNTYLYGGYAYDDCVDVVPEFADVERGEPSAEDRQPVARCLDIGFVPYVQSQSFITVASISLVDEDESISKETILGNANAVYASSNNVFLAQSIYPEWGHDVIAFSGEAEVVGFDESPREGETVDGEDVNLKDREVVDGSRGDLGEPVVIKERERVDPSTVISRISIDNGRVRFESVGSVPGHVLNQFSMDEFDGNFRIATTLNDWSRDSVSSNNLYILDTDLEVVGSITGIAPGEQIYSARFMGEKVYMVTFEQVDPLFVIDASNPKNPVILGKLKIPGFSNYLHPLGDNYLLGIGQEVVQNKEGNFLRDGVKIAIFDVRDLENPVELHKEVLGGRFSSTVASYDHRAVLFDEDSGLFVLPVTLTVESSENEWYYPTAFQGAYVYDVSVNGGFDLRGKVSHYTEAESEKFGEHFYGYEIMRSLYIDDTLYTLSNHNLQSNSLKDLSFVKRLEVSSQGEYYYGGSELDVEVDGPAMVEPRTADVLVN